MLIFCHNLGVWKESFEIRVGPVTAGSFYHSAHIFFLSPSEWGALARPPMQLPKRVGLAGSYLPRFDFMCVDLSKDARRLGKIRTFLHSVLIRTKLPAFS